MPRRLHFRLDPADFAIRPASVHTVINRGRIRKIPGSSFVLQGATRIRDLILPVIDLRQLIFIEKAFCNTETAARQRTLDLERGALSV